MRNTPPGRWAGTRPGPIIHLYQPTQTLTKEPATVPQRESGSIKIAILGGDVLVSRSLEISLQGAGYDACYLNGSFTGEPAELPEDTRLIIFAPRMSAERREAFLSKIRGSAATAGLPVLELSTVLDEARAEQEGVEFVTWPCSAEELAGRIEATLRKTESTPDSGLELGA